MRMIEEVFFILHQSNNFDSITFVRSVNLLNNEFRRVRIQQVNV
jgi:hypothetical protein